MSCMSTELIEPSPQSNYSAAAAEALAVSSLARAFSIGIGPAYARAMKDGYGRLPVCIAKTPYSFSADESLLGAPEGHVLPVREARYFGAFRTSASHLASRRLRSTEEPYFAKSKSISLMSVLPKMPSAERIHLDAEGRIEGLS